MIDAAAEVYVVTPTLPGRLAWLADDVDRFRHIADERLDTVLGHMRSIGADARGLAGRGSVPLVVADAVAEFEPNHVLVALRSPEHANWQERRLSEDIEERFGLPVTTYAVDLRGHTPTAHGPLLLCYDGSDDATHAIERAGTLFAGRQALVVTVWRPPGPLGRLAWSGETKRINTFIEAARGRGGARRPHRRRGCPDRGGGRPARRIRHRRGARSGLDDDPRDRRPSRRGNDRHGLSRTHRHCAPCCWAASRALSSTTPPVPRSSSRDR